MLLTSRAGAMFRWGSLWAIRWAVNAGREFTRAKRERGAYGRCNGKHLSGGAAGMAIGDALGAPLIGLSSEEIAQRFGSVTSYLPLTDPESGETHRGEFTRRVGDCALPRRVHDGQRRPHRSRDRGMRMVPPGPRRLPPLAATSRPPLRWTVRTKPGVHACRSQSIKAGDRRRRGTRCSQSGSCTRLAALIRRRLPR